VRVAALPIPTEREKTQWYFQRYVAHLPAAGEIVLFDRSWYTRAGVERVMGFATNDEVELFLDQVPSFENMLIDSGIILIKYWFSVSEAEQERRFQSRLKNPLKRWKLSPMDLEARSRWDEYSKAKDDMFDRTDTESSPWIEVPSDSKKHARINCLTHLLSQIPYEDVMHPPLTLTTREESHYDRPSMDRYTFVPDAVTALVNSKSKRST
jgi:polyphosphate kinase 2